VARGYCFGVGESAPVAAADGVRGFPAALTSFIGRDGPLREVAGLLEQYRLVTVTGPGGSGKTRLAGQVAGRVAARFADGAWLVELAPVQDPAQVAGAVAAALGVREQPGVPVAEVVGRVLARQQLLLVLDNCEHVIGAAVALCAGLLAVADDVRVLATSREPLALAGEARHRLGPLSLPGFGAPADAAGSEAVALFADRAHSADPRFALDEQTAAGVARLVTRLDGMPLAIELAAARVESLGVGQLLDRLDDRFTLLAGADRLAAPRQRSLAATVEWSYQLLDEEEQRVFRALSVFPAGFTLDAAEAVAGGAAGPAVLHLVDCSLLVPPRAGPDGRARYLMLETLRAYGARLLAAAREQDDAAAALAGYMLELVGEAAAGLQASTAELAAVRWLDAEDATLREVLRWATGHNTTIAVRLAVTLAPWWHSRGRLTGQHPVLRAAVDHVAPGSDIWYTAQFWLGIGAFFSGDLAEALRRFTATVDATRDGQSSHALADGLAGRSMVLANVGRLAEAVEDGQQSLAITRNVGYPAGQALALYRLIAVAILGDDMDSASRLARQTQQVQGDIPGWIARRCTYLTSVALAETGDLATAERICRAALDQAREVGDLQNQVTLMIQLAVLDLQTGRPEKAPASMHEAFQIAARTGVGFDLDFGLDWCGQLCAATGRYAEALTLWAALAAILRHDGFIDGAMDARYRREPLRTARHALGPARARAAEERGKAMSRASAVEYALALTSPDSQQTASRPGSGLLSPRERQLISLVAQGRTDAEIATDLHISIRTVRSHLDRIRDKTGCRRRADLTRLALTAGLI
jgi:predicted ATPase/DNA-binding CsgD family transcriptional regulator